MNARNIPSTSGNALGPTLENPGPWGMLQAPQIASAESAASASAASSAARRFTYASPRSFMTAPVSVMSWARYFSNALPAI